LFGLDLVYVILFPQLVCVVHFKHHCNTYGSLSAYFVGLFLRGLGGEDIVGLPPIIKYPYYSADSGQLFPFRTFAMLMSFTTLLTVSAATKWLFESGRLPPNLDIFHCVVNIPEDFVIVQEPHEEMTVLNASQAIYYQTSEMNGRVNPALDTEDETINKITNKDTKSDTQIGTKTFEEIRAKPTALIGSIGPGQVIVTKL
jgi:hypothetical protein